MSQRQQGQQQAIASLRKKNRELQSQNELLYNILQMSDMKGFAKLICNSQAYFGGIYDRLGTASKLLTTIAWDNYPDESFSQFIVDVKQFSPELASIFLSNGITTAVIAPGESVPAMDKMWQLATFGELQDYSESPKQHQILRIYTLELFNAALEDGVERSLLENLYATYETQLEAAVGKFCEKLQFEVLKKLAIPYGMTLVDLMEKVSQLEVLQCLDS